MAPLIDMRGKQIGELTVLEPVLHEGYWKWRCLCSCGKEAVLDGRRLRNPNRRSCGHLWGGVEHGNARTGNHSPEYGIWVGMFQRVRNPRRAHFHNYGGRGIKVCDRWRNFENFLADVGARPSPIHTLDRYPNKNGNYEPGNVRWATPLEQARNTRTNRTVTIKGVTRCVAEWAQISGISPYTIYARLNRGLDGHAAVFGPKAQRTSKRRGG